ncbi:hypothetical protein [Asticcacaulis biprosthecium]|uniref:hypothetical protein n=1 Tax=Asticcacaulis biprosthecium TaxID=76891 RepID=UPI00058BD827|nr:hypothetical protein [Asticcacaulis biprosthecium]
MTHPQAQPVPIGLRACVAALAGPLSLTLIGTMFSLLKSGCGPSGVDLNCIFVTGRGSISLFVWLLPCVALPGMLALLGLAHLKMDYWWSMTLAGFVIGYGISGAWGLLSPPHLGTDIPAEAWHAWNPLFLVFGGMGALTGLFMWAAWRGLRSKAHVDVPSDA